MVSCSTFTDSVECVLTYSNEYNIKLIVLILLLVYSFVAIYFSRFINKEKSYMHFWGFWLSKVLGYGYLIFSPLFLVTLLLHSISLEIFITIIVAFYLLLVGLFIGSSIYIGTSHIWRMFGFDDWNELKDTMKERKSMRKYG